MQFVPLHVYSGYSFLRSGLSIAKIVGMAKKNGYSTVGLSDFETLSGYPEFYHTLEKYETKPVFGLDVVIDDVLYSLFLHNEAGDRNLIKIAYEKSKGTLNRLFLLKHQEGLSVVLPSESSPIYDLYKTDVKQLISWLRYQSTGIERFYLGVPYMPSEQGFVEFLRKLCEKYPYEKVAFPHFLYARKNDAIVPRLCHLLFQNRGGRVG